MRALRLATLSAFMVGVFSIRAACAVIGVARTGCDPTAVFQAQTTSASIEAPTRDPRGRRLPGRLARLLLPKPQLDGRTGCSPAAASHHTPKTAALVSRRAIDALRLVSPPAGLLPAGPRGPRPPPAA